MHRNIKEGARRFRETHFEADKELFEKLGEGQNPRIMFVTCSDSRINPYLITNSKPGDLFVVRNAGNIIPRYDAAGGAEAAAVELAVLELKVENIIICAHSGCGAMTVLFDDEARKEMPLVDKWLDQAESTRHNIEHLCAKYDCDDKVVAAAKENALQQIENLRTHPCVAKAESEGHLILTACYYNIPTGEIFAYMPDTGHFELLE